MADPLPAPLPTAAEDRPAPLPAAPVVNDQTPWADRLWGLAVLVPAATLLVVAAGLTPNTQGMGTHTQLGLAPCGFEVATGLPCASCGMTTAFSLATDGRLVASFLVQPAGMVLAVLTAMAALAGGWALFTGLRLTLIARTLWTPKVVALAVGLVLLAWLYTATRRVWLG